MKSKDKPTIFGSRFNFSNERVGQLQNLPDQRNSYFVRHIPGKFNVYGPEFEGWDGVDRPIGDAKIFTRDEMITKGLNGEEDFVELPYGFTGGKDEWVIWNIDPIWPLRFVGEALPKTYFAQATIFDECPRTAVNQMALKLPRFRDK